MQLYDAGLEIVPDKSVSASDHPVENLMTWTEAMDHEANYWLLPEGAEGEGFVLDYKEPPKPFQVIKIVNTHNGNARDKSAKEFAVFVR